MRPLGTIGTFAWSLLYLSILWGVILFLTPSLEAGNFLQWDAEHYRAISQRGYQEAFRTAFFPLFPLLWSMSGLGPLGVSIMNGVIFLLSFILITRLYPPTLKELILSLSFPGTVFMFFPYSEATFFLGSALLLFGLFRRHWALLFLGGIVCGATRPAALVMIPALILPAFFYPGKKERIVSLVGAIGLFVGLAAVSFYQQLYTGEWLSFMSAQKNWDNSFRLPSIPFKAWGGDHIVMLEGSALFFGTIAGLTFLKKILGKKDKEGLRGPVWTSLAYLAGITLLVLLFRGGSLFSLNRFVYATAFFMVLIAPLYRNSTWKSKELLGAFFLISLFFLVFFSHVHIQVFLTYELLVAFLCLLLATRHPKPRIAQTAFFLVILGNFSLQVWMASHFLTGGWIG